MSFVFSYFKLFLLLSRNSMLLSMTKEKDMLANLFWGSEWLWIVFNSAKSWDICRKKKIQNISLLALIIQLMVDYFLLKVESDQNSFSTGTSSVLRIWRDFNSHWVRTLPPQKTRLGNQIIQACLTESNFPVRSYCNLSSCCHPFLLAHHKHHGLTCKLFWASGNPQLKISTYSFSAVTFSQLYQKYPLTCEKLEPSQKGFSRLSSLI